MPDKARARAGNSIGSSASRIDALAFARPCLGTPPPARPHAHHAHREAAGGLLSPDCGPGRARGRGRSPVRPAHRRRLHVLPPAVRGRVEHVSVGSHLGRLAGEALTMGVDCDILAAKFSVAREDQDKFALRSHTLAQKAVDDGILAQEITEVALPPKFAAIKQDNGIRVGKLEKLASLSPAFVKPHGTLTAAN